MPRSISLLTVAVLTAVTALLGWPASGQAATDHDQKFTKTPILIDVRVGPSDSVPCTVQADLYTPEGVDAGNKAPAILTSNGFGGSKDDDGQKAGASAFAKAGYVAISYSGLGFGGSDCKIYLDDPDYDGKAGKQIVDVLAGSAPYAEEGGADEKFIDFVATDGPQDPRVGMIGGSYGGQNQFAIAGQDDRVDAIIPTITWNDLSYSLAPNNTDQAPGRVTYDTPGVAKKEWIDLFFGLGIVSGLQNTTTTADPNPVVGCPNFRDEACRAAAQLNALGYPDDTTLKLARHASVGSYLEDIKVPTLLVQGQNDTLFNIQEAVATYRALKKQGTTVAMSWFSGGHSGDAVAGDLDLTGGVDASHQGRRWIDWMDRFVRGDSTASAGPEFEYFQDWVDYVRHGDRPGLRLRRQLLRRTHLDALPQRHQPTDAVQVRRCLGLRSVRRFARRHVVLRDLGGGQQWSDRPTAALRHPWHVRVVHHREAHPDHGPGRLAEAERADRRTRCGPDPGSGPRGQARPVHQAVRRRARRHPEAAAPTDLADPGEGRQQAPAGGVARRRAALRRGSPDRLVVAGGDSAYANNSTPQPVTILTSRQNPGTLTLPLVSSTTGSCPMGTTGKHPFCETPVASRDDRVWILGIRGRRRRRADRVRLRR